MKTIALTTYSTHIRKQHSTKLVGILLGFAASGAAAAICIPLAYAERGYQAIGGEWIAVIGAFFLARWLYKRRTQG